ncbi:hypothetical protein [Nostoc sp.]
MVLFKCKKAIPTGGYAYAPSHPQPKTSDTYGGYAYVLWIVIRAIALFHP